MGVIKSGYLPGREKHGGNAGMKWETQCGGEGRWKAWNTNNDSELDPKTVRAMCGAMAGVARAGWASGARRSLGVGGQSDKQASAACLPRV